MVVFLGCALFGVSARLRRARARGWLLFAEGLAGVMGLKRTRGVRCGSAKGRRSSDSAESLESFDEVDEVADWSSSSASESEEISERRLEERSGEVRGRSRGERSERPPKPGEAKDELGPRVRAEGRAMASVGITVRDVESRDETSLRLREGDVVVAEE